MLGFPPHSSPNQNVPPLDPALPVETKTLISLQDILALKSHFRVDRSTFLTLDLGGGAGDDRQSGFHLTKAVPLAGNACTIILGFFDVNKSKRRELLASLKSAFKSTSIAHF